MRYPAASTARLAGLAFLAMTASNTASAQPAPDARWKDPPSRPLRRSIRAASKT